MPEEPQPQLMLKFSIGMGIFTANRLRLKPFPAAVTFWLPTPTDSPLLPLLLATKLSVRLEKTVPKEKPQVNIGEVIKTYRSQRGLSQGDIERRTGLLRCYLSRVENGHTVPSLETLAKIAEAMEISLADFFPGTETPRDKETQKMLGELSQDEIRFLAEIKKYSTTLSEGDKRLVLAMIRKMATLLPTQAAAQAKKPMLRRPSL
jgi:transcriptional regulator with XRE-family HTH domain